MTIQETSIERIVTLCIGGRITSGPDVSPLKDRVKEIIKSDVQHIVIDLSRVAWIGSAMLGVLAHALVSIRNAGGDLRLIGVNKQIASALRVTRLDTVFETVKRVEEPAGEITALPIDEKNQKVLQVA